MSTTRSVIPIVQTQRKGTGSLENEAIVSFGIAPVVVVECDSVEVISDLLKRELYPVFFESRATVAQRNVMRGAVCSPTMALKTLEVASVPSLLMGLGVNEKETTEIIELILLCCNLLEPAGSLALAYRCRKNNNNIDHLLERIHGSLSSIFFVKCEKFDDSDYIIRIYASSTKNCIARWEGSIDPESDGSLALVNLELGKRLFTTQGKITIYSSTGSPVYNSLSHPSRPQSSVVIPDIVVRHRWPPDFNRPACRYYVHIQPWEFGALPQEWFDGLCFVDEIWCYTEYVATLYRESGYPAERIFVLPLGFNPDFYYVKNEMIKNRKKSRNCVFSFVGGLIPRKGSDVALEAYFRAFTADDDVELIIKSNGSRSFYGNSSLEEVIRAFSQKDTLPKYTIVDDQLSEQEIADIYRKSDALVAPFRGEGFGLPALEAMACGVPVIYTAGGAMDDFIHADYGYPIKSKKVVFDRNSFEIGVLRADGWLLEPNIDDLINIMKEIYKNPEGVKRKGMLAAEAVRNTWTWEHAASKIHRRLDEISHNIGFTQ